MIGRLLNTIGEALIRAGCWLLDWRYDVCIMPDTPYRDKGQDWPA
jgi:hypothetical protein